MTRYLALGVCVLWAATAAAQTDVTRPNESSGETRAPSDKWDAPPSDKWDAPPSDKWDAPPSDKWDAPPSDKAGAAKWGAVAYTADGAFGAAYGFETKEEAERLAIDACRRESTDKADCSRGVVTRQDSWFHIQFCRRDRDWTTHVTTARTLAETNQSAAQFAQTSRYGANSCRMVPNGLFHSGGQHTKM